MASKKSKTTVNKVTVKKPVVVAKPKAPAKAAAPKKSAAVNKADPWKAIPAAPVVKSREATPGWFDSTSKKKKKAVSPPVITPPVIKPPVITPPVIIPPVVNPPVINPPVINPPVTRGAPKFASALVRSTAAIRMSAPTFKGYDAVRGKPPAVKSVKRARTDLVQAGHPKRASPVDRVRKDPVTREPDKRRDCTSSKERPKDNRPKGGGGSKKFVPWKGTKYGC